MTDITQAFLVRALSSGRDGAGGHEFVDRVLLSLIFHCAKDGEHARAVQELEAACGGEQPAGFTCPSSFCPEDNVSLTGACVSDGESRGLCPREGSHNGVSVRESG